MDQNSAITAIKGIGEKTKDSFAKMGVYTVGDILLRFPRTYIKYPSAQPINEIFSLTEERHAIAAKIQTAPVVKNGRRMQITLLTIGDSGHKMQLIWYRMPYIKNNLQRNHYYVFYGKVSVRDGKYVMEQPVIYTPEAYQEMEGRLLPVYTLTTGITNNLMTKTIRQALDDEALLLDYIPKEIRHQYQLCEYNYAIKEIHFPDEMDSLIEARRRLVFDEFFDFILGMQYQKERKNREENAFDFKDDQFIWNLMKQLPYDLTGAQKRTLEEIVANIQGPYVMQRLIQGDVGSGKTVIAFLAMAWAAESGYQSAIMAPTEVLARQHYETFCSWCENFHLEYPVVLLTGSMTTKEKDVFADKGNHPHILVMSATPIPRTLAINIYGDMDISVIDEVPAKRLPIKNCVVNTGYRPKAYEFIAEQIKLEHQAYIICPLVEASESMEGENVTDYARQLAGQFSDDVKIGVLHGKMKNDKKNAVMEQFAKNEIQILVSTTVVEVGVNVPNATVMLIENADRFGLAQLHQLRGRVGRGDAQSYCIMVNASSSKNAKRRLEILNKSNDGFFIASEDLKLRGPGDFFGIRQSGDFAFELADIYQDASELKQASEAVAEILNKDPDLELEEHKLLRLRMKRFMEEQIGKMNL